MNKILTIYAKVFQSLNCLTGVKYTWFLLMLIWSLFFFPFSSKAQTETFSSGSFIINMGVVPQTVGNALKPYGLVYSLTMNFGVPVKWIIEPGKAKDGTDFTYNGVDFKGGSFIIPGEYRTAAVNTEIAAWQAQGVIGLTTTVPVSVPVYKTLTVSNAPRWTLDYQNGSLAQPYFTNAGIPSSAYGGPTSATWKTPAQLGGCDDIFVMPHADPRWATHGNLLTWNQTYKGAIWLGCHAGSALEDMFNPAAPTQQTNFLTEKTGDASGAGPYFENALTLWSNHSGGTPPYSYDNGGDPVMQFMGPIDGATQNGSEQIYIPKSAGWRSSTVVGGYDPDHSQRISGDYKHRAAVIAYGRGFGDANRGMVMLEAAHAYKGTTPDYIAAQRAFFNFSLIAAKTTAPDPGFTVTVGTLSSGDVAPMSFTITPPRLVSEFNILWSSSCGGTFSPNNTSSVNFTAPQVAGPTDCTITITLTEKSTCGRVYKNSTSVPVACGLQVATTVLPACYGLTNGSISMVITGGPAPFVWSWTKSGGGSGAGTGTAITGLASGTYTVVVTAENGTGCSKTFTITVNENPQLTVTPTPTHLLCNLGASGSINLAVSGGSPAYTYLWAGGATTQNRTGLAAGAYNVTVTDSKSCTATASSTLTQPDAIVITPTVTDVVCNGGSTGAISLVVTGGTGAYSYAWGDGPSTQNRTGLSVGTYSVIVTDANSCTKTSSGIVVSQPSSALSLSATSVNVTCYGGSTGSIDLTPAGGTEPYAYNWGSGVITQDRTSLPAGTYMVTVTDHNGCIAELQKTISQNPAITLSAVLTHETCPSGAGSANGAVNLTVSGGTGSYSYSWTGPSFTSTSEDISSLIGGTYTVVVTDTGVPGCTATTSVTIKTLNSNPVKPTGIN